MCKNDDNTAVFSEGRRAFQQTMDRPIKLYRGGTFLKDSGEFPPGWLDQVIDKEGIVAAQQGYNHVHCWCEWSEDIDVQRYLAWEAIDIWRERVNALCAAMTLKARLVDDGFEITLTFWITQTDDRNLVE